MSKFQPNRLLTNKQQQQQITLKEKSSHILSLLKKHHPVQIPEMDMKLHYLPPHIPKALWTELGDHVVSKEKQKMISSIDGSKWISLRLDGQGFSKLVKKMKKLNILNEGFSIKFAEIMKECLYRLLEDYHGMIGYTQSDEMIIFIPPANLIKGIQQPHVRNGRISKLTTLASGFVSSIFTSKFAELCYEKNIPIENLTQIAPHFDCRIAYYDSWEEAQSLLLWRAYDCSVNGISDAVYQTKKCPKEIRISGKREKLNWLYKNGYLPLHTHQAYGTCYVRVKRLKTGFNPKLNKTVISLRSIIVRVDGPVHELLRTDTLIPKNDVLLSEVQ
jgi:tRNA(His) 5'-end guanylyltransferase